MAYSFFSTETPLEFLTFAATICSLISMAVPLNAGLVIFKEKRLSGNFLSYALLFAQAVLWVQYCIQSGSNSAALESILLINGLSAISSAFYLVAYYLCPPVCGECFTSSCQTCKPFNSNSPKETVCSLSLGVATVLAFGYFSPSIVAPLATAVSVAVSFAPLPLTFSLLHGKTRGRDFPVGLMVSGLIGSFLWGAVAALAGAESYLVSNIVGGLACAFQLGIWWSMRRGDGIEYRKLLPEGLEISLGA